MTTLAVACDIARNTLPATKFNRVDAAPCTAAAKLLSSVEYD
jgi:hypothetical protein